MVKKSPLINIIVRSHNRTDNFKATYNSIKKQTYKNTQIIAGADNEETEQYLIPYKCRQVRYAPNADKGVKGEGYGIYFPFNHYINVLKNEITDGWFMGLDDDDMFLKKTAIETIVSNIKDEDTLLIWRVDLGTIIPTDANFGKNIVCGDISGIGFMCHIKHIKDYVYEPYRRSDYRIIKHLSEKLNVVWIDEVLTGSQNKQCNYGGEVKQLKQIA
jgi:glycosyltransferase involved in cell wall biosynthesis